MGDRSQRAHGARQDDHSLGRVAAGGNGRTDVGVGVLHRFCGRAVEQFFEEVVAARQAQLFGQHAERVLRGHKVDAGYSSVRFQGAQDLAAEDRAGCAGKCDGKIQLLAPSF